MYPILHIGDLEINVYFVVMALALALPLILVPARAERLLPDRAKEINSLVLALFFSALVGFRLFHVFLELPDYYLHNPLQIFMFWKGGFVAYGGLFFPLAVAAIWIKVRKLPALTTADILALPTALVFVVARLACFLNGCCYGAPTSCALGVSFPPGGMVPPPMPVHPTQLYLSASALAACGLILLFETRLSRLHFPGLSTAVFLLVKPLGRFIVEFFRADFRGGTFWGLTVSQNLSLLLMALGGAVLIAGLKAKSGRASHPETSP